MFFGTKTIQIWVATLFLASGAIAFAQTSPTTSLPKKTLAEELHLENDKTLILSAPDSSNLIPLSSFKIMETPEPNLPYFYLGPYYVASRWEDFTNRLQNGSLGFEFGLGREIFDNFDGNFGLGWHSGISDSENQGLTYAYYFQAGGKFFVFGERFRTYLGLDLDLGSYRIWSLSSESSSQITYSKHGSGSLIALFPSLGFRIHLGNRLFSEVYGGYMGAMDSPQWRTAGWAAGIRFSFVLSRKNSSHP